MSDFLQLAQSLTVALKALQMYTAAHPRAQDGLAAAHASLEGWLAGQERIQFVVSGTKAFLDGQVQDTRSPHVAGLVRLVAERGVGGFVFERGLGPEELQAFLQGLATKPQKLQEQGGFEALLQAAGARHIRVSQTRYQEVGEGEQPPPENQAPSQIATPAPPPSSSPSPENLVKFIREALLSTLAKGPGPALGNDVEDKADALLGLHPADLSGLGPLGLQLGLGEGMPTPRQLSTLRQVLMGLSPATQLGLLAGLSSLPAHPAGLALGVKALAGEILAQATTTALAKGSTWAQRRAPGPGTLRAPPQREVLGRVGFSHPRMAGLEAGPAEAMLRFLDWESLSLEAKLLRVLEAGQLFHLSLDQRLALLRELLDCRRFDAFLRIQDLLLDALRSETTDLRMVAIQTLAGIARWAPDPGLPLDVEGPLADGLRAHFVWEPEPPLHRWTTEGIEALLKALVLRQAFNAVLSDLRELMDLCVLQDEPQLWRNEALARLRQGLASPQLLDAATHRIFTLEREQMLEEVQPYLEFLGDPMARHLVGCLESEANRTRRGRLVEALRSLGGTSLPALLDALGSSAWYLVRNVLTLLTDLGNADCLPSIIPLLRHPEPRVRRTAVRALWKLGGPLAEPHLLARIKDTDGGTLEEILFAFGQLKSEGSLAAVSELIQDKRVVEKMRLLGLETLAHIGSPKAMPLLLECLRRKGFFGGGEPPAIRLAAAKALAALGTPEAQATLQKVWEAEPKGEERDGFQRLLVRQVQP